MVNVNIRMEEDTKRGLEQFCNDVGLSVSACLNLCAKAIARGQRLPFELVGDPFYSAGNQAALQQSLEQLKKGEIVHKTLEELRAYE